MVIQLLPYLPFIAYLWKKNMVVQLLPYLPFIAYLWGKMVIQFPCLPSEDISFITLTALIKHLCNLSV